MTQPAFATHEVFNQSPPFEDVDLYTGDAAIPADELRARIADKEALVCLLTDAVDASVVLQHAIDEGMIFVPGSAFYADAPDHSTRSLSAISTSSNARPPSSMRSWSLC